MGSIFQRCKLQLSGIARVLPSEVPALLREGAILVDLRSEFETEIKAFGVENICYLEHEDFDEKWSSLPLDKPLILADAVGIWSNKYAAVLHSKGYENVASLAGGIADWEKDGFSMKQGKYQPLNGPCPCMIRPKEKK
jgi:rhodanese-related sulfurtransferase